MSGEYQIPECAACAELRKRVEFLEVQFERLIDVAKNTQDTTRFIIDTVRGFVQ